MNPATLPGLRAELMCPPCVGLAGDTAEALAELLALLRRHPLPAFGHSPPKIGAMKATTANASEQNPAENQQSDSLPEGNLPPSEQHRQQPVPQMHHQFAANCDEDRHPYDRQWCYPNSVS